MATKKQLLEQIPEVKIHNYAFRNNGQLHFSNVTNDWGLTMPSFSNGAVYADLDNDGDLDLVVNNINDPASLYRNNTNKGKTDQHHYLNIRLQGVSLNRNGLGASVMAYYAGKKEVWENILHYEPDIKKYFVPIGIELFLDKSESYAILRQ